MAVGVLCAVQGSAEAIIVQAVEQTGGRLSVTRRCADLTELLAAAEAGLGRLAVVSGDLDLLDREAIELLHRAGVRVVGIGDATRPWLGERLAALGADLVAVAPHDEASASDVVREALAILGAAPDERAGAGVARRAHGPPSGARSRRGRLGSDGRSGPHDGGRERGRGARRRRAPDAARGRRHLRRERRAGGRHARRGARARRSGTRCRAGHPRPDDARPAHPDDRPGPAGPVGHLPGGPLAGAARPRRSTPCGRSRGGSPSGR